MNRTGNIPLLNALRAFAAFGVFIVHSATVAFPRFFAGAVFVDIFMVLSGFLMCYNYVRREEREPWDRASTVGKFYLTRFFRIAPVYYVCLLYFFLVLWNESLSGGVSLAWNIIEHVTFIFSFDQIPPDTKLPDWSLGLEMQFYLCFPFLMLFVRKTGMVPLVVISAVICWLFKQAYGVYLEPGPWGTYLQASVLPLKFTLFTYGMLIAYVYHQRLRLPWYACLLLAVLCALPFKHGHSWGVLGIAGVALTVNALPGIGAWFRDWLVKANHFCDNRFLSWLADISYGFYLIHSFVLIFLHKKLLDTAMSYGAWVNWLVIVVVALLILLPLTTVSYYLIEKTGIEWGRKLTARFRGGVN